VQGTDVSSFGLSDQSVIGFQIISYFGWVKENHCLCSEIHLMAHLFFTVEKYTGNCSVHLMWENTVLSHDSY
jgi:hypothetical protein